MQSSAKPEQAAKNGELVRYSSDAPFAFMREIFERFDFAMPRVDIEHKGDQLFIQVDLPGISPDDIEVSIDEYWIELKGERRRFGRFERLIPLPNHVDPESAEARLGKSGRLVIRPSGTEPLIRVMAEADDSALVESVVDDLVGVIAEVKSAA